MLLGIGVLAGVRSLNNQKLGSKSKAAVNCAEKKCKDGLGIVNAIEGRSVYVKYVGGGRERYKYYKDQNCKYEVVEGVGNYCKADITNPTNCIDVSWLYPKCRRMVFKKESSFYGDAGCKGLIEDFYEFNYSDTNYCKNNQKAYLAYSCPEPYIDIKYYFDLNSRGKKYYTLLEGLGKKIYFDNYGVGNFCKIMAKILFNNEIQENSATRGLMEFTCRELGLAESGRKAGLKVYADLKELIENMGNLDYVTFYKYSSKESETINIFNYCGFSPTPTRTPTPTPN
ncbi:MAG: hypothetical protein NZM02_00885 [Patescibacteria group bacterium]|nr:hypothetical protein [Patescibacteria group bacterium]